MRVDLGFSRVDYVNTYFLSTFLKYIKLSILHH